MGITNVSIPNGFTGNDELTVNGKFDLHGSIRQSGIVYYRGLFGALLMVYLLCRIRRQNFEKLSDILTIGISVSTVLGESAVSLRAAVTVVKVIRG